MARGAKKTYDDQLELLEVQIEKVQSKMDSLLETREELLKAKRDAEIGKLYEFMISKGVSAEQLMEAAQGTV